ncbi:uncharacterized protein N7473_007677 [Penicillium subrubescens]|jgi:hypothetical protein|uniref:uncharacterized protein n=1 Tax=Penicillium subrubescens TaxID=1316194 RepID=UPI00254525FA|nr:uncharacterized protein N7473_007677 [Penicillium subrubescens]KAJ5891449.1 hypothetical protein N7473_007677 [Penicillium subrubescens]
MPKDAGLLENCCEDLTFVFLYYRVQGANNVKKGRGETLGVHTVVVLIVPRYPEMQIANFRERWPERLSRNELTGNP